VSSAFTLDKVLANAKSLVTCLKEQEATVESLLSQTQDLSKKVESMKMVSIMSLLFYTVSQKNIPPSTCNNLYISHLLMSSCCQLVKVFGFIYTV